MVTTKTAVSITEADITQAEFAELVERHVTFCDGTAPPGSCHRLEIGELATPDITVWQANLDGQLVGMGALKALGALGGEVKSMHTVAEARGRGVGLALLSTIKATAQERGYPALWLETGVHPGFDAARQLYTAHGFVETQPFSAYKVDPHSIFMTCDLTAAGH